MNFEAEKNLELINCDYDRLQRKRKKIQESNEEIRKANKKNKNAKTVKTVSFVLVVLLLTGALGVALWFGAIAQTTGEGAVNLRDNILGIVGLQSTETEVSFVWKVVPYVLIGLYAAVVFVLIGVGISKINTKSKLGNEKETKLDESFVFAAKSEGKLIGGLELSEFDMEPYKVQKVAMSCELADQNGSNVQKYSSDKVWSLIIMPGMFHKCIDVEHKTIIIPYVDNDAPILTVEEAVIHERWARRNAEMALEASAKVYEKNISEYKQQIGVNRKQIGLLENELVQSKQQVAEYVGYRERCEKAENVIDDLNKQIDDAKTVAENQKTEYEAKLKESSEVILEERKSKEELQVQLVAARESEQKANQKLAMVDEEYASKLQEVERIHLEEVQQIKTNASAKIEELSARLSEKESLLKEYDNNRESEESKANQLLHDEKVSRERLGKIESEYNLVQNRVKQLERENEELRNAATQNESAKVVIDRMKAQRDEAVAISETMTKQKSALEERVRSLESERDKLAASSVTAGALIKEKKELEAANADLKNKLSETTEELDEIKRLSEETIEINKTNKELRAKAVDTEALNGRLTADLVAAKKMNAEQASYISVLEQKLKEASKLLDMYIPQKEKERLESEESERQRKDQELRDFAEKKRIREEALKRSREEVKRDQSGENA